MPIVTLDPPETGEVEAMRTGKGKPSRSAGTVARKATGKASAGKSAPIRREPVPETVPDKGSVFVTRHEANSMKQTTPISDEMWYIDSGASNHMTSHKEWFSYLQKPMQPGVVATGDDTSHPIANFGEAPLSHVGQKGKLMNVLHVVVKIPGHKRKHG